MHQDRRAVGPSPHVSGMRRNPLLRQLAQSARDEACARHEASCRRLGRTWRALAVLLSPQRVCRVLMSHPVGVNSQAQLGRFADDVAYFLSLTPRQLPSRYLYDDLGSALFEAICRLPWYHITRLEQELLGLHRGEIVTGVNRLSRVVELG